jgi:hypothetical protein
LYLTAFLAASALQAGTSARAATLLSGPGGGVDAQFLSNQTGVAGFGFTVGSEDLLVTRLGVLDLDQFSIGNGLSTEHTVTLWNADGTSVLGSATVPAGGIAPLVNGFRYVDLATPIQLTAGQAYVLGASYANPLGIFPNDFLRFNTVAQMQSIISGDVTYNQGRIALGSGFPTGVVNTGGYVGPNFEYSVGSAPPGSAVPAPPTVIGGLFGVALLGVRRLRRRGAGCGN